MALKNPLPIPKGKKIEIAPGANSVRLERAPEVPGTLNIGPPWQLVFSYGEGGELHVPLEDSALKYLKKVEMVANAAKMR